MSPTCHAVAEPRDGRGRVEQALQRPPVHAIEAREAREGGSRTGASQASPGRAVPGAPGSPSSRMEAS
jgi:hypothetical protein